jgi:hypothetical protein
MSLVKMASTLSLSMTLGLLGAGCGNPPVDSEKAQENRELNDIFACYMHYARNHEQPPRQLSQLNAYKQGHPGGIAALTAGKYKVAWGVKDRDAETVLAYEKDAPTQGGAVLMADGTVKQMSAEQFQAVSKK